MEFVIQSFLWPLWLISFSKHNSFPMQTLKCAFNLWLLADLEFIGFTEDKNKACCHLCGSKHFFVSRMCTESIASDKILPPEQALKRFKSGVVFRGKEKGDGRNKSSKVVSLCRYRLQWSRRDFVFFCSIFILTAVLVFLFPEYTVHVAKSSMTN